MSIGKTFFNGISWTGSANIISGFIQFSLFTLLALYLSSADLGVISVYFLILNLLTLLTEFGFSSALIQNKNADLSYFTSVLLGSIVWGACLSLIFFLLAENINLLFLKLKNQILIDGLEYLSVTIFFTSLIQVYRTFLIKKLRFSLVSKIDIFSSIIFFLSNILLIIILRKGILGFVYSIIIRKIFELIVTWSISRVPLNIKNFKLKHLKELAYFGLNTTGDRLITFLANNLLINIIIGRNFGAEYLGQYNLAYQLLYYPQQRIGSIISTVSFPTFSFYQEEHGLIKNTYLKIVKYLSLIIFPINIFALFLGSSVIHYVYGDKYLFAEYILPILAIGGIIKFLVTHVGSIIYAKGRADIGFIFNTLNFILTIMVLEFSSKYGFVITIALWVCLQFVLNIFIQTIGNRLINLSWLDYLKNLFNPILGVLLMSLFMVLNGLILDKLNINILIEVFFNFLISIVLFYYFIYKNDTDIKISLKNRIKIFIRNKIK